MMAAMTTAVAVMAAVTTVAVVAADMKVEQAGSVMRRIVAPHGSARIVTEVRSSIRIGISAPATRIQCRRVTSIHVHAAEVGITSLGIGLLDSGSNKYQGTDGHSGKKALVHYLVLIALRIRGVRVSSLLAAIPSDNCAKSCIACNNIN
jgi:hypothetical protein